MADDIDMAAPGPKLDHLLMRDDEGKIRRKFVEEVAAAIHEMEEGRLREIVGELHEADLGDLIAALEPHERVSLVELTGTDFDFSALNEVDDAVREEILEELEPETVAEGVRELESDDAVALLEGLNEKDQEEILEKLPPPERDAIERRLLYPEDSAGRRMQSEFIAVPPTWTVGEVIDHMRETPDLPGRFYEIYAVDAAQHWQGAVSLDRLLRSRRPVPLTELIDEDRRRVSVLDDLEEVARLFGKYNLVAAPVVDTRDRLVGVITIDDVVDVIEEEAEEDLKALGGVTSDEELSDDVWTIAKGRFNWLLVNLATAFLASAVLGLFEGQLEKALVLTLSPLAQALFNRMCSWDQGMPGNPAERRVLDVFLDEMRAAQADPLHLTMPRHPRLLSMAAAIAENPADSTDLDTWAERLALSRRSITRHFRNETGMSLVEWRQVARLQKGMEMLTAGVSVTTAAMELGYDSVSSFIALFRRVLGTTPAKFAQFDAV